jgi:DNA adenine methylase
LGGGQSEITVALFKYLNKNNNMRYLSPLRYPGGKASLTGYLGNLIDLNDLRGCSYYEPYAGGAGAALGLLRTGTVMEIFVNDADERIGAFWLAVLDHSNRFVDRIFSIPLTITEWRKQRDICLHPQKYDRFDVGFAAFYMNRCNRSGVLTGSGPIGGYEQSGKWRLDVRFSRSGLAERIIVLAKLRERIHLSQLDALDFLKTQIPRGG